MGEGTPSPLGTEHAGNRDFIRVAEKIAGLAFQLLGGHHARVYRLDGTTFGRVASAGPDAPTETTAASVDADVAWSRLLSPADPARGTVDVLAESACRLDPPARRMIQDRRSGARAAGAIRVRGAVAGSLVVADQTGRRFTDRDLALLTALADQAAVVAENAQLRAELAQQRYEADELALVAGLIGQSLDHAAVAQRIAESVLGLLGVHSSAIRLFRPDGDLGPIALAGRAKEYAGTGGVVPAGAGLVGRAAIDGRPAWTSDIRIDERFDQTPELRARNVAVGIVAGLAVPMRAAGRVMGVLSVGSDEPRTFSQREIDLLQRFADQAALTISNARTREALVKQAERLRMLHDIDLAIIAETAPAAIAEAVLWRLRDLLGVPRAIVNLFDWAAGEVEWLAAVGRHRIHRGPGVRYPLRLAGDLDALRRGEPQIVDVRSLPPSPEAEALLSSGVHVYMVVPMITAGELIGSVSFGGDQAQFPDEQVSIAREVATQLAIALGQARLVEKLKASYVELQQAQAQLAQSQKIEAIGQLAGGIAHDFNNLLTVIGGRSSLLLMRMRPDDPARKDVDLIQSTTQRAADLTRQLLAFSRKQVLEPKPINLKALVAGVTPILRRLIGEHIEIVIVSTDDAGRVMADPGQIEQVIVNLVVNARDAMPEGGTLTIETTTHTVPDAGRRGLDRNVPPGEYVTLSIRDTGCGMDPATMARIFEPFFTTKEPGKGTGLGLSTVHGIVHQSGGHLALDSAVGRGTTFTVYLPRVPDQVGPAAGRSQSHPELVGGSGTVLLVEDDEDLRRLTSELLHESGYTVVEAADPLEALTVSDRPGLVIDLLLTDMVMPAMRGPELAARLAETRPGLAVLFMSGYTDEAVGSTRPGDPARAFLQKPFTPHDLTRAVRGALASRRVDPGR
ncbi:MAG TPA: GAF domain-containing protein [Methylomirabilota bacterium]|nr:GAF domain-containing protein [Methylomirabilota bacterium]